MKMEFASPSNLGRKMLSSKVVPILAAMWTFLADEH
jgi:hypothetical protein